MAAEVADAISAGHAKFNVCAIAMKNQKLDKSQLLPDVRTVPDGIGEIVACGGAKHQVGSVGYCRRDPSLRLGMTSFILVKSLGFAANFGPPPAQAYEEEAPVMEKFRLFAFKRVAYKLENPAKNKESQRIAPERVA